MRDLNACETPPDLFTIFHKLGYPVEQPAPLPLEEDDLPGALREGVVARYSLAVVGGVPAGAPRLDVTLFVLRQTGKAGPMALARGIGQQWPRRFAGLHLLVFAVPDASGQFQRAPLRQSPPTG